MKKRTHTDGIYEAWSLPGGSLVFESITAREMKPIGAFIIIGSSVLKFRIEHHDDGDPMSGSWKLLENWPLGTKGAVDNWQPVDDFTSLKEARAEARRLARKSAIKGPPGNQQATPGVHLRDENCCVRYGSDGNGLFVAVLVYKPLPTWQIFTHERELRAWACASLMSYLSSKNEARALASLRGEIAANGEAL